MQELQRKLDHDGKLEQFLAVKGQKRVMRDLEEKERRKREQKRENMQKQLEGYKEMLAQIMVCVDKKYIRKINAKVVFRKLLVLKISIVLQQSLQRWKKRILLFLIILMYYTRRLKI